jgi:hypothetical protein
VIAVLGEKLLAHPMGALFAPRRGALIVADLHFEKGSSFARRGVFLPPYDTRATLMRLAALCRIFDPAAVISLGDAFHDDGAETRLAEEDAEMLAGLIAGRKWIWILGNHDPAPPRRFAGETCAEHRIGALTLRHEPTARRAQGEIAGHLHPCARIRTQTRTQRRRCFVGDGERLVLPAFGAYAGGLNVLDDAFRPLFREPVAWALGESGVYCFDRSRLVPDAAPAAAPARRRSR